MNRIICILIGYLFGIFQTGYLYGKLNNIDIRNHGSGNAGTTNALRTLGLKAGVITFLGDCLKCVVAVALVKALFDGKCENLSLLAMYTGAGVVLGHNFPFYLGFKGGKGIAATAGLALATEPFLFLIVAIVFIMIVAVTRYVSLGSLIIMIVYFVGVVIYGQNGYFVLTQTELYELYAIAAVLTIMAFVKHRANVKRLLNGTENKISFRKKVAE